MPDTLLACGGFDPLNKNFEVIRIFKKLHSAEGLYCTSGKMPRF
jgi:hypothetical protein